MNISHFIIMVVRVNGDSNVKSKILILATAAATLAGCTAPLSIPHTPKFQSQMGYYSDWRTVAHSVADNFVDNVLTGGAPVFVQPGPADMPFAAAFTTQLENELLQRGAMVSRTPNNAIVLEYDVQTFWYRHGQAKSPVEYASFWTTAYAIGLQIDTINSIHVDTETAAALAIGPILDLLNAVFDSTDAEVAITTTARQYDRLLFQDTDVVYITPTELPYYWTQIPDARPRYDVPPPAEVSLPVVPLCCN